MMQLRNADNREQKSSKLNVWETDIKRQKMIITF